MIDLPKTVTGTVFVMLSDYGCISIQTSRGMTDYGWVILSEHEVTYDVPQENPALKVIGGIEDKIEAIQTNACVEIKALKEKIQQLKAIEYKGEA